MPNARNDEVQRFEEFFAARRDVVRRTAYLLCGDWHWADDGHDRPAHGGDHGAVKLAPRQRAALVCRYYQGLDVAATAEVLGCSARTPKGR